MNNFTPVNKEVAPIEIGTVAFNAIVEAGVFNEVTYTRTPDGISHNAEEVAILAERARAAGFIVFADFCAKCGGYAVV